VAIFFEIHSLNKEIIALHVVNGRTEGRPENKMPSPSDNRHKNNKEQQGIKKIYSSDNETNSEQTTGLLAVVPEHMAYI